MPLLGFQPPPLCPAAALTPLMGAGGSVSGSTMASTSTSPAGEVPWERLPEELLLRALPHVMLRGGLKRWCGAVRRVSRRWRAVHDTTCTRLRVRDGVTDEMMHALCGRLPKLVFMNLFQVASLTDDGLRAVGGLTALTELKLNDCSNITDAGLTELSSLSALTTLSLYGCTKVTDVGLRNLSSLTALTELFLPFTSTTQAGQNALKAAIPALVIHW